MFCLFHFNRLWSAKCKNSVNQYQITLFQILYLVHSFLLAAHHHFKNRRTEPKEVGLLTYGHMAPLATNKIS